MTDYQIKFTDKNKTPIMVAETSIDNATVDISLFGRKRLEYGRDMNANFLHILENFACAENPLLPGTPDISKTSFIGETTRRLLEDPTEGQLWFNETQETLFVYDGAVWVALGMVGDIAANWGVVAHGASIPRPVNQHGYEFQYSECSWIVSPFAISSPFTYMQCLTDDNAKVTMLYTPEGSSSSVNGCANYLIVGIKDNVNIGGLVPIPSATPGASPTPTPTPTRTRTPLVSPTSSITPTPGVSSTGTPMPTSTPAVTPTKTPAASSIVYSTTITSPLGSGPVLPGTLICYNITLNAPAPVGGYPFTFSRSGDFNSVCASTNGELGGPLLESLPTAIPAGQTSIQICRNAPSPPPPAPTPTATPRTACKSVPGNNALQNGSTAGYNHGFMCANTSGGALVYFTNSSGGVYSPCTVWSACNDAQSFVSTQTITINPVREGSQRYNATPAVMIALTINIPGVGNANYWQYLYGTSNQQRVDNVSIGGRIFQVTVNMYPVLVSSSGSNRTWQVTSDYNVIDVELGTPVPFC